MYERRGGYRGLENRGPKGGDRKPDQGKKPSEGGPRVPSEPDGGD